MTGKRDAGKIVVCHYQCHDIGSKRKRSKRIPPSPCDCGEDRDAKDDYRAVCASDGMMAQRRPWIIFRSSPTEAVIWKSANVETEDFCGAVARIVEERHNELYNRKDGPHLYDQFFQPRSKE